MVAVWAIASDWRVVLFLSGWPRAEALRRGNADPADPNLSRTRRCWSLVRRSRLQCAVPGTAAERGMGILVNLHLVGVEIFSRLTWLEQLVDEGATASSSSMVLMGHPESFWLCWLGTGLSGEGEDDEDGGIHESLT